MPPRDPLEGIQHYDLSRLTQDQAGHLDEIIKKSRSGTRLNAKDVDRLGAIRRAVKCRPGEAPTDPFAKISADLRKLTDVLR